MHTDTSRSEITLHIRFKLDGEEIEDTQELECVFIEPERILVTRSSGMLADYCLFFGDEAIIKPLRIGGYELVGVVFPSKMRHFESSGGVGAFPMEALHKIGGDCEPELMCWITHIPAAQLDKFCETTGRVFEKYDEVFSGINSVLLDPNPSESPPLL